MKLMFGFVYGLELATEKARESIFKGVEGFDANKLKNVETQEKIILPDKDGNYWPELLSIPFIINSIESWKRFEIWY